MINNITYSQCGEDSIINFLANDILHLENTSYLDIGCNDPIKFNNTYLLYKQGILGVSIDANPYFKKKYAEFRPGDKFVCAGIGPVNEKKYFYVIDPHTLSTFSRKEALSYTQSKVHKIVEKKKVQIYTIQKIIEKYFKKIKPNILYIDVEGYDLEILKSIDFNIWRPAIVCVETLTYSPDEPGKKILEIFDLLKSKNYFLYADTYINSIFVEKNAWLESNNLTDTQSFLEKSTLINESKVDDISYSEPNDFEKNLDIKSTHNIPTKSLISEIAKRPIRKILHTSKIRQKKSLPDKKHSQINTSTASMQDEDLPCEYSFEHFINLPLPHQEALSKIFKKNSKLCIFDIGMCEGEDTIRYSNKYPNSTVHSFEPITNNMKIAKENIEKYTDKNRVILNNIALSDKNGSFDMYVSEGTPTDIQPIEGWDYGNKSSSLLKPEKTKEITPWLKFNKKIKVQTKTLVDYCKENKIEKIDLIHMDVQGAELMVLKGAKSMIKNIRSIWLEVEAVELYKGQPLKSDVEKFMMQNGFIKIIDTVNEVAGDQFYINKSEKIR